MESLIELVILVLFGLTFFWIRYFYQKDRQEKEPARMIILGLCAGAAAAIAAALVEAGQTSVFEALGLPAPEAYETEMPPADPVIAAWLGVQFLAFAAVEEAAKLAALLFFYRSRYFNEASDGIFYGIIIGLGFGLLEDIGYVLALGPAVAIGRALGSLLHPAFTGTIGYFLGRKKMLNARGASVSLAFLAIIFLHAFFNWLILWADMEWANAMIFGVVLFLYGELFILYNQAQKVYATVYCTACGAKNRAMNRFCIKCGTTTSKLYRNE